MLIAATIKPATLESYTNAIRRHILRYWARSESENSAGVTSSNS